MRAAWRANAAFQGLLVCAMAFWLPVAVGLAAGAQGRARLVFVGLALAAGGAAALAGVLYPLFRPMGACDAAFLAEKKIPWLAGRAAGAVELWEESESRGCAFDPVYMTGLYEESAEALKKIRTGEVLNTKRTVRLSAAFAVFIAVFAGTMGLARIGFSEAASYIAPPYLPKPEIFRLEWVTGNLKVPVGGAARIEARFSGAMLSDPVLIVEREGLEPSEIRLEKRQDSEPSLLKYSAEIPSVAGDMTYRVAYKKFISKPYRILAIDLPRIRSMSVRLKYPQHTGLLPDERSGGGDLRVPYGARATFRIESTVELKKTYLKLNDGAEIELSPSGPMAAEGEMVVRKNARYTVHLVDGYGFENRFPPEYLIESIPDEKPRIAILQPENDLSLPRNSVVPVRGEARDDYGVSVVRLHARVVGVEGEKTIPIGIQPAREILFEFPWDLSGFEAFEGDTIEFYLSATDNDALTGPKTSLSETRRIHLLSQFEDYKEIEKQQDNLVDRMESLLREGNALSDKLENLAQNPGKTEEERRRWRAEAQRAMDRRQELDREMNDIAQSMSDTIKRMQENSFVNLETLQKMRELNQLMGEIMTDEVRALMDQIRKQLENMDLRGVDRKMMEAMMDQEKLQQSLDQTIQRFKRIRTEQRLSMLKRQMKELAERQQKILDKTNDLQRSTGGKKPTGPQCQKANQQSREQGRMAEETESALATSKQLAQDLKEDSPGTAGKLNEMNRTAENKSLIGNMQGARDSLGQCDLNKAGGQERKALDTLREMSDALDTMQRQFQSETMARTQEMIRRVLRKTLDISEAHEAVRDGTMRLLDRQSADTASEQFKPIVDDEQVAREASVSLVEDAARLAAFSMAVPPQVPALAAEAAQSLSNAVDLFSEGNYSRALSEQNNAALRLNQLAIALLDAQKRAAMPSSQSELDSLMSQLEQLAQSQENLNAETQRLSSSGLPIPQISMGLQSLAIQQQMIREGLNRLAQDMEKLGQSGERLGRIGEEMEEIQRDLARGNADQQVQRRQSNVLRRLQDATLSLRKESLEDHRIAERGKDYAPAAPQKARDLVRDSLPQDVREEMDRVRREPAPKGYERMIDNYYRELMRGEQ